MTKRLLHRRGREGTSLDEAQFSDKSKAHSGRFEDFRSGHALYILDQTYCYKNQRFLQSRRISCPRAETNDSRDNRQIFGAFIPSTETDIFAEFKFSTSSHLTMHATDCKC